MKAGDGSVEDGADLSCLERIVAVAASGLSTLSVFGLVLAAAFGPLFILVDLGLPGAVANMLLLPSAFGAALVARAAHRHLRRGLGRQLGQRRRRRQRALQAAALKGIAGGAAAPKRRRPHNHAGGAG